MRDLRLLLSAVGEFRRSARRGSHLDWLAIAIILEPDLRKTPRQLQLRYHRIVKKVRCRLREVVEARVPVVAARSAVPGAIPRSADVAATRSGSVYAVTDGRPLTRSNSRPGRMLSMHRMTKVRKKRSLKTTKGPGQRHVPSVKLEGVTMKPVKTESIKTKTKAIKAETVDVVRGTSMKLRVAR